MCALFGDPELPAALSLCSDRRIPISGLHILSKPHLTRKMAPGRRDEEGILGVPWTSWWPSGMLETPCQLT